MVSAGKPADFPKVGSQCFGFGVRGFRGSGVRVGWGGGLGGLGGCGLGVLRFRFGPKRPEMEHGLRFVHVPHFKNA